IRFENPCIMGNGGRWKIEEQKSRRVNTLVLCSAGVIRICPQRVSCYPKTFLNAFDVFEIGRWSGIRL
ncbi:MAG: hypothetical protein ACK58T_24650, partial [Phycisphaerae bacterium]